MSAVSNGHVRTHTHSPIRRWSDCIFEHRPTRADPDSPCIVGVLEGEGIGPGVIRCALQVLSTLDSVSDHRFEVEIGGAIGSEAKGQCGKALSQEVDEFCQDIFSRGGAILTGAGGGRFVYDLRKRFDLFCKLSPLEVRHELVNAGRIKPEHTRSVDILVIRENLSGVYQGRWDQSDSPTAGRIAEHSFSYAEVDVRRILNVAANIALQRLGEITVIYKDAGIPGISALWRDCTVDIASALGVRYSLLDVDYAAFQLLQHAQDIDVVVAPNLFGDVLSDLGAVLLGSRGLTYSGNFAVDGAAVYQTNHGAAYDLVGTNRANPVGQILALAMLLRESFGFIQEAHLIEEAVAEVWRQGWRTPDLAETDCRLVGTLEMGNLVADAVTNLKAVQ